MSSASLIGRAGVASVSRGARAPTLAAPTVLNHSRRERDIGGCLVRQERRFAVHPITLVNGCNDACGLPKVQPALRNKGPNLVLLVGNVHIGAVPMRIRLMQSRRRGWFCGIAIACGTTSWCAPQSWAQTPPRVPQAGRG